LRQLPRFTYIELRKLGDTRSAKVLLLSLGFLGLATLFPIIKTLEPGQLLTLGDIFGAITQPLNIAMAIIGIMGMTGDWTHNITTSYFPLVKNRGIIFCSKIIATFLAAFILLGFVFLLSIVSYGVISVLSDTRTLFILDSSQVRGVLATTFSSTLFAMGIAAVARRLVLTIILVVVLTIGVTALVSLVPSENVGLALSTLGLFMTLAGDPEGILGETPRWAFASSITLWNICPLILGWFIMRKAEA
jgi:hypothetical protein